MGLGMGNTWGSEQKRRGSAFQGFCYETQPAETAWRAASDEHQQRYQEFQCLLLPVTKRLPQASMARAVQGKQTPELQP